jgi:hypothetical protein
MNDRIIQRKPIDKIKPPNEILKDGCVTVEMCWSKN